MRILIVEDDQHKLQEIAGLLLSIPGLSRGEIHDARSSHQARSKLLEQSFDVLILDIHLPRHLEEEPRPREGLDLISDLREDDLYRIPTHIIGITARPEVFEDVAPLFAADLFGLVFYDRNDDGWRKALRSKVVHSIAASNGSARRSTDYRTDVAIVTAVDVELAAMLRLDWSWSKHHIEGDHLVYWTGMIAAGGRQRTVALACAPMMGLSASSVTSCRLIEHFSPKFLIMAGVTAGIEGRVAIGDIICADPTWDWGSGKYIIQDGLPNFLPAPYQLPLDPTTRSKINRLRTETSALAEIRGRWPSLKPPTPIEVHIGPLASGAAVLADLKMAQGIQEHNRNLLGVDMETYAVYQAAFQSMLPKPVAISLKAVCDFADPRKSDGFQPYASYASAEVVKLFVEHILFDRGS